VPPAPTTVKSITARLRSWLVAPTAATAASPRWLTRSVSTVPTSTRSACSTTMGAASAARPGAGGLAARARLPAPGSG
jgi:hypothetical protein